MPELTQKQFASKGGKSRWQGKSSKERSDEMRRVAKVRWGKQVVKAAIVSLFLFSFPIFSQSTCSLSTNGLMVLRPKYVCSDCVLETSTSLIGPWFQSVHVWGERQCADISFTIPKTKEPARYWRLRIIR